MLSWPKFLKYAQGIMLLETLEADKIPSPVFGDQMAAMKFQQSIQNRLKRMWDSMFPHSRAYYDEVRRGAMEFKEHLKKWRGEA